MMKIMKKLLLTILCLVFAVGAVACGAGNMVGDVGGDRGVMAPSDAPTEQPGDNYQHDSIIEKPFYNVSETPDSIFTLDRNTATYSLVRRQINQGLKIASDSVRVEEMINYFNYDYPAPIDGDIALSSYLMDCPWNEQDKLMLVGVKTKEIKLDAQKNNFVFLVDVSGSMYGEDRLGLVKKGLNTLVDNLTENDRVSIVTYASGVDTKLESTLVTENNKTTIKNAISSLNASGSTNGSGGLQRAYEIAKTQYEAGVNSRVIIMSDGDFNVGISDKTELMEFIQTKASEENIYLSVLGFGMLNTRDDMLETMAINGNGNYAYIDSEIEVNKVLTEELSGTLKTVAKDTAAKVTFNADTVEKYRLIGYDTKYITEEDFNNPEKDKGEIGSNLCVSALYQITLKEEVNDGDRLATAIVRYKDPETDEQKDDVTLDINLNTLENNDIKFVAGVAYFGLILRESNYKGTATFESLLEYVESLDQSYLDGDVYKKEFVSLVHKASEIYLG